LLLFTVVTRSRLSLSFFALLLFSLARSSILQLLVSNINAVLSIVI